MKRSIAILLLLAMILGVFAGCGKQGAEPTEAPTVAPTEETIPANAKEDLAAAAEYLKTYYKDALTLTARDYTRLGAVRVGLDQYPITWSVDVSEDIIKIVVNDDGTVTIDIADGIKEDTPYVLTATLTDAYGNVETVTFEYTIPASLGTMQEIVDMAYALENGDALEVEATLTGEIISVNTPYDAGYKNVTVTIKVAEREDFPIMCYRMKGEGADTITVGDTITVTGILKNYNGTIEFDAGCKLEEVIKGDLVFELPSDPKEIVDMAYALGVGESIPVKVTLTGKVTDFKETYTEQYKNISVWMTVEGRESKPILVYRVKGDEVAQVAVGDTITVSGSIINYNGTIEFTSGCSLDSRISGGGTPPSEPVSNFWGKVVNPGETYYMYMNIAGTKYYFTGKMSGNFLASSTNSGDAVEVTVEAADEYGRRFYFMDNGTKKYIEIYEYTKADGKNKGAVSIVEVPTATFYWSSDAHTYVVYGGITGDPYFMGSYTNTTSGITYTTFSVSSTYYITGNNAPNAGVTQYIADFMKPEDAPAPEEPKDPSEATTLTIPEANELGKAQAAYTAEKYKVTGKITNVVKSDYGNLYIADEDGNEFYIYGTYSEDGSVRYDKMNPQPKVGDTITIYGIIGQFNGTPQMKNGWVLELIPGEGGEEPEQPGGETTATVAEAVVANTAYKFGMVQGNVGKTYYLKGGMDGYFMATTENVAEAIDVYLEETAGGYYFYIKSGDTKTYINMVVSADGEHVNGAFEATASTVYTWDAESKTIIAIVNDAPYWFGTRNDKNYTTMGPCATSYNGFYAQFYTVSEGGETPEQPEQPGQPEEPTVKELTIAEAYAMGAAMTHDTTTTEKYQVTGVIESVASTTHGNMTISDGNGNTLYVYGTWSADGSTRYDALEVKPVAGDTVTLLGVIGNYNGAQMKNAWIVAHTPAGSEPEQPEQPEEPTEPTVATSIVPGTAYKLGLFSTNKNDTYYFTGVMSGFYGATQNDYAKGIDMFVEETTGGYYLYFVNASGAKQYIYMEISGTHYNFKFGDTKAVFVWDAEKNALKTTVGSEICYIGTYGSYVTMGVLQTSKLKDTDYIARLYTLGGSSEPEVPEVNPDEEAAKAVDALIEKIGTVTKESEAAIKAAREAYNKLTDAQKALVTKLAVLEAAEKALEELNKPETPAEPTYVTSIVPGTAYKLGLFSTSKNATYYFTGSMSNYYGATQNDYAKGIDMFVEETTGGYYLYFLNTSGVKQYVSLVPSGTHRNFTFSATANSVFSWDAEKNALYTTVSGEVCYMGTYGTYVTMGVLQSSKLKDSDYIARLYTMGGSSEPEVPEVNPDEEAAKAVDALIEKIGTVTKESEAAIKAAREAYNKLTDAQKALVTKLAVLEAAEKALEELNKPVEPEVPAASNKADFNTIVTDKAFGETSYTKTFTTANGWVVKNSAIHTGTAGSGANPQFPVVGPDNTHKAPCLNGKTSAPGSITSPTLTGGISKLTIKYTKMFTDTKLSATITITDLATGNTYTNIAAIEWDKNTKYEIETFEWTLATPVTGDFTIAVVNNCPTSQNANKDRMTVLELAWEHAHKYEATTTATCVADGITTYTCKCGDTYTEETAKLGHLDENLDVECDREGCTSKVAPPANSLLSNFTANNLGSKLSVSSQYYVQGTIVEVLDAKNGIFLIDDGTGETFYFRLPKNADGVAHASWAIKLTLGDKVKVYGKINKYSTNTAPNGQYWPAIQSGVVTLLEQHPHDFTFSAADCKNPAACACGQTNGAPRGCVDADGNSICDDCGKNTKYAYEYVEIRTDNNSGVHDATAYTYTWTNGNFGVQVAKASGGNLYVTAKDHMRLYKGNQLVLVNKNGLTVKTITVYLTNATQVTNFEKMLTGYTYTTNAVDFTVTVQVDSFETITLTNTGSTTQVKGVEFGYAK